MQNKTAKRKRKNHKDKRSLLKIRRKLRNNKKKLQIKIRKNHQNNKKMKP